MSPPREFIDHVDADDQVIGRGLRGQSTQNNAYYRVAATILLDGSHQVLVYRRPDTAAVFPGHHDVLVGGSVRAGETYLRAAERELAEELGVHLELREALRLRCSSPAGPCHLTVHLTQLDGPVRPDPAEIAHYEVRPLAEVLAAPPQPFVPTGIEILRLLFG